MEDALNTIDLAALSLTSGEGRRIEGPLSPRPPVMGGERLGLTGDTVGARLELSRTSSGWAMRLSFAARVEGPCTRCLAPAAHDLEVEAREVEQPESEDPELHSPYVEEGRLDLLAWSNDALALSLPAQLLCHPGCPGLCSVCGERLEGASPGAHDHGSERDPRWAKLDELRSD